MIFAPMLDLLGAQPALFTSIAAVFGLLVGSFLNVVIHRLPLMMQREWHEQCAWINGETLVESKAYNLVIPRSACPKCDHLITWYENIPVLSWLVLRGRCSSCGTPISRRYPLVEILTGVLFGYAAWRWGVEIKTPFVWGLLASLVALAFIDLDTQLLPDSVTLPLAWVGLLVNLNGLFCPLDQAVIGAVAGYLTLWSIYHLFKVLTGKEGMGFGDFKLLAALGAWLGWKMLLPIVLAASLAGALIGIVMITFAGRDRSKPMPFGPWLALGGLIALFWGDGLLQFWLGTSGVA
ncbi:MAG: prepilin peptidase [Hydrogenophilales bacterium 28-61-23]|nr:MAG: prepilin peptidase [Hydrogenophilales bacterium 28-61-23]